MLRVDGGAWASIGLYREQGREAFDAGETELVASLSEPLAGAVREHARPVPVADVGRARARPADVRADGELLSANDEALAWLEQLPPDADHHDNFNLPLPMVVGRHADARAGEGDRDRAGAAALGDRALARLPRHVPARRRGEIEQTALVIEPAHASEIAPIIVQAYELSPREQEITRLIAQGLGTAAIAARLHLSAHTVRDHVKAIFEKVGVSSRGELVATLFAEHYAPTHFDGINHDRVASAGRRARSAGSTRCGCCPAAPCPRRGRSR